MDLQLLVPTVKKNKDQIFELCESLNIQSDCIIANQNGKDEEFSFLFKGFNVKVICTKTIGVSINRNILLKNVTSKFGLMLDDDCVMIKDYPTIINNFFESNTKAEFVLFNGNLVDDNVEKPIHKRSSKQITRYHQISYAGAPGLCFKTESLKRIGLLYDETLGVPNYIEAGEDSVFHFLLLKSHVFFYRSNEIIFYIKDNNSKSSYFNGVDKRYVETRGYVTFYIHPKLYGLYKIKHCLRFRRASKGLSFRKLISYFDNGKRLFKNKMEGI